MKDNQTKESREPERSASGGAGCYAYPTKKVGREHHQCEPDEATHLWFQFANEDGPRCLPVQTRGSRAGTGNWTWNGSREAPTLKPSLATKFTDHKCHVWINDGKVIHLADCTCGLAGKTERLAKPDVLDYFSA